MKLTRTAAVATALMVLLLVVGTAATATSGTPQATVTSDTPGPPIGQAQAVQQPNIVLINLDDADVDLLDDWALQAYFPNIKTLIADSGTRFQNFHVVAPLCGPSRGSLFRGQYPHNTGITENPLGWEIFYDRGYTDAEMGQWMRDAGYQTALVGKYCHEEYPQASNDDGYVPPGWDRFHASLGGRYFDTPRNVDGRRTNNGNGTYRTDAERSSMLRLIEERDPSTPLFLYVAPFAPHGTQDDRGMVAPRFENSFTDATIPRTPDFDEADVSDKTPQYQQLPAFGDAAGERYDPMYVTRIQAMLAVDQLVGELFDSLDNQGMRDNTYVMLTSDNGFQLGHHRDMFKKDPFDRVTRVQLLVSGPGVARGVTTDHLLGHIDLVPTLLDLAGSQAPEYVDGQSFAPLLSNPSATADDAWRHALLIENSDDKVVNNVELNVDYVALRRFDDVYVEWANGDREYYDLTTDPFQLDNSWADITAAERTALIDELAQLRDCAGPTCRGESTSPGIGTTSDAAVNDRLPTATRALTGSATAALGVDNVEVVLRRVSDRSYWNGTDFQNSYVAVDATFTSGASGAMAVTWELPVIFNQGTEYWLSARTVDTDGNEDSIAHTGFFTAVADSENPEITSISTTQDDYGVISVIGVVVDDLAVDRVELTIRDESGNYWNGVDFGSEESVPAKLVDRLADASDWSSGPLSFEPGNYEIEARAFDAAGRQSAGTPVTTIAVGALCAGRAITIPGTVGPDVLTGTPGNDVISGFSGNDRIDGRGGNDTICGGTGSDTIVGGEGSDALFGGPGRDTIDGDAS